MYHPMKDGLGYSDSPKDDNTFLVTFAGDSSSSIPQVRDFCYIRAAELAVQHNAPYFQVLDEKIYLSYELRYWPGNNLTPVTSRNPPQQPVVYSSPDTSAFTQRYPIPEANLQIRLLTAKTPDALPAAYFLKQANTDQIPLAPETQKNLATLPSVEGPVTLPPAPTPVPKPPPIPEQ
jgi:hypothetical protein